MIRLKTEKMHLTAVLCDVCAILVLLWITNGALSYLFYYIPKILKMGMGLLWFLLAVCRERSFVKRIVQNEIWIFIFIGILLFLQLFIGINTSYYLKVSIFIVLFYSMYLFYVDKPFNEIKWLVYPVLFDFLFIAVNTLFKLLESPNIARYLSHGDDDIIAMFGLKGMLGIGNYTYAYSLVLVALVFVQLFLEKQSRIYIIPCFAFSFLLLLKMSFTFSIVLLFGCIIYMIYISPDKKIPGLKYVIGIAALFMLLISYDLILLWLPEEISVKIKQVTDIFASPGIGMGINLADRIEKYMISINTIKLHPILGTILGGEIGNHSTWIDFYAMMGIFSLPIYIFVLQSIGNIKKMDALLGNVTFVFWGLLGLVNTAFSARLMLTIYCLCPFIIRLSSKTARKV